MESLEVDGDPAVDAFVRRWTGIAGSERADAQSFLNALCELIGVDRPHDARADGTSHLDYGFERPVRFRHDDGTTSPGRIDLYKKGCFVLEAKQSSKRQAGGDTFEQLPLQLRGGVGLMERPRAKARPAASWDALMRGAKRQAEDYARCLDEWPPFILVVDVGQAIELYANFRRDGKGYEQYPDRNAFRVTMEGLRSAETRARLKAIWEAPLSLDPAARAAEVTQGIAALLAEMTRSIEPRAGLDDPAQRAEHAYKVSKFLMRCIFAMFAEDMGLLPEGGFLRIIEQHKGKAKRFHLAANDFFEKMDRGGYNAAIQADIRRFNGGLFREAIAVEITGDELSLLEVAARREWRNVEPAIFGTLLERALSKRERASLGAHYTPRAYVERLVAPTIIEPLREDWDAVQSDAIGRLMEGRAAEARTVVKRFHDGLCRVVVLDPACGTANFLYVALELMKRLEGEVLDFLAELGEGSEPLQTVHPRQFRGIEKNPRAVPIAELVLWIGYIQWWFRTRSSTAFADPALDEMNEIAEGDALLAFDRQELLRDPRGRPITRRDPDATAAHPITGEPVPDPDARLPVFRYVNPRPATWPEADYIVGNPPFISGKGLRSELGDGYAEALWASRGKTSDSIDLVMYWWDQAATILRAPGSRLRRFGFITTNSITQKFSRRVLERHLAAPKTPASIVFAVPDHPWVKTGRGLSRKAAVRIAMTVAERGVRDGKLAEVVEESGLDTDQPRVVLAIEDVRISADLTSGTGTISTGPLMANAGLCYRGVQLMGAGFIVSPPEAKSLGLGRVVGLEAHIRPYRHGRDLTHRPRNVMVIDLLGLDESTTRNRFPLVYQRLLNRVRPERDVNSRKSYRDSWWIFGEPRRELRPALADLPRYIVTSETAKHRMFQFLDGDILPDNMLVVVPADDAFVLGVLSSRIHVVWTLGMGGTLEDRPRYTKSRCFDPFPFPVANKTQKAKIGALAEELDSLRKAVIAETEFLTMTRLYNVRERLIALDAGPSASPPLSEAERAIHDAGCVGVIHELHRRIDAAVAAAYGWPADLSDDDILARLVALNAERAEEERNGLVRWLRPDYQVPRFGGPAPIRKTEQIEATLPPPASDAPALPREEAAFIGELRRTLRTIGRPAELRAIASRFRDGPRASRRIERGLQQLVAAGIARRAPNGWFVADRGA